LFLLELVEEESNPLLLGIRQVACSAEIQIIPRPFPIVGMVRRRDRALYQYRSVLCQNVCWYINHRRLSRSRLIMKIVMLSDRATIKKIK